MSRYEQLQERLKKAKANKKLWEDHISECYDYFLPERNTIDKRERGAKKRELVFDSTPQSALEDFANRMTAMLVPPNRVWLKLEAGSDIPEQDKEKANKYLEETTDTVFKHIRSSNFTSQITESFMDLGISTGAIIVEEGDGIQSALNFRSVPLPELILERSQRGIVETTFREMEVPAKDIPYIWKNIKIPDELKQVIENNPTMDIKLIEGVIEEKPGVYSFVVLIEKFKSILYDEKIDYNPTVVFRESVIPGETYGRGRAMRALPDAKTLNRMVRDYLKGLAWHVNPIITGRDDGIINPHTTRIEPGAITPVGSNDRANPTLGMLQPGGQPQLLDYAIRTYQDNIRKLFLSKPFGNIEETPVRTATEMSIRNADLAETTLASSMRIQTELLERIMQNCVTILRKQGKIAPFKVDGKEVALKFVNPASIQQNEAELAAIGRAMEMIAGFDPQIIMQKIKMEDIPVEIFNILGIKKSLIRDEEETAEMVQAMQQQQQAMMQGQIQ